jgi:hypothetical protein
MSDAITSGENAIEVERLDRTSPHLRTSAAKQVSRKRAIFLYRPFDGRTAHS